MADRTPITSRAYRQLQEEVHRMKTYDRPACAKAIEIARAHGDLSENAEYDAAKQAQGLAEAKIRDLESKLSTADVVDVTTLSGSKVIFGATVTVLDMDTDEEKKFSIVGEYEADIDKGWINYLSPLARGLIGKSEGDLVEIHLPAGVREYEIVKVEFIEL